MEFTITGTIHNLSIVVVSKKVIPLMFKSKRYKIFIENRTSFVLISADILYK